MSAAPVIDVVEVAYTTEQRNLVLSALGTQLRAAETAVMTSHTDEERADAIRVLGDPAAIRAVITLTQMADPRDTPAYRTALADHLRDEHGWRHTGSNLPTFATLQRIHANGHRHEAGHRG